MDRTEQPGRLADMASNTETLADIFPNGVGPTIQVGFWNPAVMYVALGIAIAAIVIAAVAVVKSKK